MEENLKIRENGNLLTCGVILIDKFGTILAGHPTGRKYTKGCYDLLKGCSLVGEEDIDTAIREMKEESGIDISEYKNKILDLGIHSYTKGKDIHLFLLHYNKLIDLDKLKCTTYFETKFGKLKPEMNGYKLIYKNERDYFSKSMQKVLNKVLNV